jgi:RimJ/RimL family protein N-acetyltransferase
MADVPPILRLAPGTLTGERTVVRPYRDDDAEAMYEAVAESRDHLRRFFPWFDNFGSAADALAFIRHAQSDYILRRDFRMGIFSHSNAYLGGCALLVQDWAVPWFTVTYWIRQSQEGKGLITEAMTLLIRAAFEELGADRLSLDCDALNHRSAAVAERLGFTLEGRARHERRSTSGELADSLYYAMLRDEYQEHFHSQRRASHKS